MFKNIVHLSKGRRIDWHHLVLRAEVDIVEIHGVSRDADLGSFSILNVSMR